MEKKTIGGFIATLRRANGMTQKDLAERLNISDKTVSRWERDDGAPDLAVIPVIAEMFGVTCDELLRGERKSPTERVEVTEENDELTPKAEKQRQRLLKSTLSQYKNQSYIAMGVSVVGVSVALICDLAFLKAVLGFFLGAIFFAAAIVCQAIFVNKALFRVEYAGLDADTLSDYKRKVIGLAQKSIGLTVAFIGFIFPLITVNAHLGLEFKSLMLLGSAGATAFLLIYAVVLYFLNASLLKRSIYILAEKESAIYHHNHKLKRICAIILVVLLAVTFVGHQYATSIWGPHSIMKGTTFEDYSSFVEYMEQDIPAEPRYDAGHQEAVAIPAPESAIGATTYYDQYGNEIGEEEAMTRRLEDKNGKVVCEYIDRNESVTSIRYVPKDGTILPITVFTDYDLREAKQTAAVRHVIFGVAYGIECFAVVLIYFWKRAKHHTKFASDKCV